MSGVKKYFFSCFLLAIPVLAWDVFFTKNLPAAYRPPVFGNNIPYLLTLGENTTRTMLFLMMAAMPVSTQRKKQKAGIILYAAGLAVYFITWLILIFAPGSSWSRSMPGFMSPAYTPLLWLAGIGLIGNRFYFGNLKARWIYFSVAVAFLILHNYHTYLVFIKVHHQTYPWLLHSAGTF